MPPHHVKVPGPRGWRGWRGAVVTCTDTEIAVPTNTRTLAFGCNPHNSSSRRRNHRSPPEEVQPLAPHRHGGALGHAIWTMSCCTALLRTERHPQRPAGTLPDPPEEGALRLTTAVGGLTVSLYLGRVTERFGCFCLCLPVDGPAPTTRTFTPPWAGTNPRREEGNRRRLEGNPRRLVGNRRRLEGNRRRLEGVRRRLEGNRRRLVGNRRRLEGNRRRSVGNRRRLEGNRRRLGGNRRRLQGNRRRLRVTDGSCRVTDGGCRMKTNKQTKRVKYRTLWGEGGGPPAALVTLSKASCSPTSFFVISLTSGTRRSSSAASQGYMLAATANITMASSTDQMGIVKVVRVVCVPWSSSDWKRT